MKILPYIKLALAMSIVGSSVVAGKIMAAHLPIMMASCLRFAIASPMLIGMLCMQRKTITLPSRNEMLMLFFQALCGVFLFSVFLLFGLKHTGSVEAGLITGTLPAVTAVLAILFLREKINIQQMIGITLTLFGAMVLNITPSENTQNANSALGMLLVFAAVVCEALFVIIGKRAGLRISPLMIATVVSILGFILFLPFAVWDAYHFDFSQTTFEDWLLIAYFGIVVSAGAFWLFYSGLEKVPASVAGAFTAFIPLSAVVLSIIILGASIDSWHCIAAALVLFGALVLAR